MTVSTLQPVASPSLVQRLLAGLFEAENVTLWLLVAVLAWAPFPLGSNRPWSWSVLCLLVAACWAIWVASPADNLLRPFRRVEGPATLAALALLWGVVQILLLVPAAWTHPAWMMAGEVLHRPLEAAISLNPWRTATELMKLIAYAMTAWLVYATARDPGRAARLFDALIVIGIVYAVYALLLALGGWRQYQLFYAGPDIGGPLAGPFIGRNSFATYAGLITLCALVRFTALAAVTIVVDRGVKPFLATAIHFIFGAGFGSTLAVLVSFSLMVATASRGAFLAVFLAMATMLVIAIALSRKRAGKATAVRAAVLLVAVLLAALVWLNGGLLQARLDRVVQTGLAEDVRFALWSAAARMVHDAPLLGLGLGTYENAYPLYADHVFPYVMDRAHNDYLELAAGWGLPAACAWWAAIAWLNLLCLRGVFIRRRNRAYPLLAVGATVMVGVQSLFDFNLQIPAIALTYAAILGLGVAQAFSTRSRSAAD